MATSGGINSNNTSWGTEYGDDYSSLSFEGGGGGGGREGEGLQESGITQRTSQTETTLEDTHEVIAIDDEVLYEKQSATVVSLDWNCNPPQVEVRLHSNNLLLKIPVSSLTPSQQSQFLVADSPSKETSSSFDHKKFCFVLTDNEEVKEYHKQRKNHFQRLSEETMMKLPHLRKHKEYIKTIDIGNGPRDYNAFREILNAEENKSQDHDKDTKHNDHHHDSNSNSNGNGNNNSSGSNKVNTSTACSNSSPSHFQTATHKTAGAGVGHKEKSSKDHNSSNDEGRRSHNKRKGYCQEKSDLYKTELCENWVSKGHCTYGRKCHFAHGHEDIRYRIRVANYKTQPCCDPARIDSRLCLFGKRCNYAHPGEPLRCAMSDEYLDEEYFDKLGSQFIEEFPFGLYM
ncbi:hypothetical protein RFI_10885 [Reticulomyxa filosa]|uniref:C3H1-type domain-containing protein n=1 Tax=Reticulomyxa filosa TaxID=46433 RepID=X6NIU4_RETFI|nr:hypothetical protein RFI_10885 [Reticulomyxa filosa]|eukprot:ETO26250.1 hypothetical protein RFI_10885 [Reticulomyxa filosa]